MKVLQKNPIASGASVVHAAGVELVAWYGWSYWDAVARSLMIGQMQYAVRAERQLAAFRGLLRQHEVPEGAIEEAEELSNGTDATQQRY